MPPDCSFPEPSADVMHVLLHDNSSNFRWADDYTPPDPSKAMLPPEEAAALLGGTKEPSAQ